ncbi:MAG: SPASM domain-containing protein [Oscillospiraceae bacterium]
MDNANSILLNRFFTRNTFKQVIDDGESPAYIAAIRRYIVDPDGKTNEENISEIYQYLKKEYQNEYSLYYKDNIIFIEKNLFHIVKKIVTGGNSYMCMSNPCGAGLSQFTVDPNADVYPCADLCGQKHFRLGNIGEDFFPMIPSCEGWREIRSYKLQNLTGCKKCTLIKTCPAGCSVRCYYSNDSVHSTDPLCRFYKLILPYLDDTGLAKKIYNIYVN